MISEIPEIIKVGIIHLSDIHFSTDIDFVSSRFDSFYNALRDDFQNCRCIFIIVSGDITDKGFAKEYEIASDFFARLSKKLNERYHGIPLKYIFVPGNHDCNFSLDSQLRQNTIKNISYKALGNDSSVIKVCTSIQTDFWKFYSLYNDIPDNKIYYKITEEISGKKICFHCFNTAWMSQIKEVPGFLFLPIQKIIELEKSNEFDLNIAIFHHPLNWFTPNSDENNKREFQKTIEIISSLQIIGHEHQNAVRKTEDLDRLNSQSLCISGEIFQNLNELRQSGFQTFLLNLNSNNFKLFRYQWEHDLYQRYSEMELSLEIRSNRFVVLQDSFINKLNRINIPLAFNERNITLSNIYTFPDLELVNQKTNDKIEDYLDSETLLEASQGTTNILEGESQIGKSSLLYMLLLRFYDKGFYPILLYGSDINNENFERIIKQAFTSQYIDKNTNYERFRQLTKDKKVLFIDDLHTCQLNRRSCDALLANLHDIFGQTFITIDTAYSILPQCQSSLKNLKSYSIKHLGYSKRNLLVEKYLKLKDSKSTTNEDQFDKIKHTFSKLCHVLGDKLIPPYPVFILSILQSLEYTPLSTNETSYGYCYQTLIHLALNNTGVSKDHIDSYMNFITQLAYVIFNNNSNSISEFEFEKFYAQYRNKFWVPDFETIKENLLTSKILKSEIETYQFGYVYILYFLAAKKIADMIDKPEGKKIIANLFENLHIEKNANILVFITHHTKDDSLIEESIFTAMLPFESVRPITLEKQCPYNNLLQEIVQEIKNDVIEMRDPIKERQKHLQSQDKFEREVDSENNKDIDEENDVQIRPFLQAFRSIEIVGQIVKNRKGSIEIPKLKEMIKELYYTGFRMISFIGDLIKQMKGELSQRIEEKITQKDSNQDIEKKINRFLQFISLQACFGIFSKFMHHVGVKELRDLFNEVAVEIDTPAAYIVSFSINSYYGKINMKELEKLAKDFKDNFVAMQILRSRVKAYIYNNQVDYKDKQRIGAYLKMEVPARIGYKNHGY